MPQLKLYSLFVSHAWGYDDYYRLINLLDSMPNFMWRDYSVPRHKPVIDPNTNAGVRRLMDALAKQIRPVSCVLIIAGTEVAYREWLQTEIKIAAAYNKPIIGVIPRGQERVPRIIQDVAPWERWSARSIIAAIRRYSLR